MDAALELFSEKGYEAASVREICERAGISRPTLYYFFKSKEGVIGELQKKTHTFVAFSSASLDQRVSELERFLKCGGPSGNFEDLSDPTLSDESSGSARWPIR